MSAAKTLHDEHEGRISVIRAIAIDAKAVARSEDNEETIPTNDENAEKAVYAKAFQAWAEGKVEGTAEDIFESVQEILEI
ncbi:hypothetical protein QWJ07_04885 [Frankia sp. RB7]|nr:hypothetical protein [Frankia sp. RB7]